MSELTRRALLIQTTVIMLALAGCATSPPEPEPVGKLTPAQVSVLKDQGFQLTDHGWELGQTNKVLFKFDDDAISLDQTATVIRIGRRLSEAGIDVLHVDGHTDNTGSDAYNLRLSMRRAEAVARVLGACGFTRDRLVVRGLGKTRPIADNDTSAGRAENRRVAIIVTVD